MSSIPLQKNIIYGPVLSRRLGRSLGINLLPTDHKACSFDCIYCQYGCTTEHTISPNLAGLPSLSDVLSAVEKALKKPRSIDYLTFSGNGEPTLHPDFPEIVSEVKKLKDRMRPDVKLALLSNSSRVMLPNINKALSLIDEPMMKLDAGDEVTFRSINHPPGNLKLSDILSGLCYVENLMIQSVLVDGEVSNSRGAAYENWIAALIQLHPIKVYIYSLERPTAKDHVTPLSPRRLQSIKADLQSRSALDVTAFWRN
jgi:wyosine [tRNA(Phe)-imidazoG37] synthetase (radical SAM superfamily)